MRVRHNPKLTERQHTVLMGIAQSKTLKEIALELGISDKTVEYHRAAAMRATGLNDVPAITRYMLGLVAHPGDYYDI